MMTPKSFFKNIARNLLKEVEDVKPESGEDSIDTQIDKYLTSYESEAKVSKNEGLDFRMMSRRFLIEAEEDEKEEDPPADDKTATDDATDKDDTASSDEEKVEEPEKLKLENIDIGSFVSDVVRLVENYDSLLEVKNTIFRRAYNKLAKSYDQETVDAFNDELLESYGVEIGKTDSEVEDDFEAPKAGFAGPMGGSA